MPKHRLLFLALISTTFGILLAIGMSKSSTELNEQPSDLVTLRPPPTNMAQLVNKSELIVIGKIGKLMRETKEGPYAQTRSLPPNLPPVPLQPFSYYELSIVEIILNDNASQPRETLVLRINGLASIGRGIGGPMPKSGDERLFALIQNPDHQSYGPAFGRFGIMNLKGNTVIHDNWEKTPLDFTTNTAPSNFLQELRIAANAKAK